MTGNLASDTSDKKQRLEHNSAGFVLQGLVIQSEDGHAGRSIEDLIEVVQAEKHGDAVGPRREKANQYGTEDRNGYATFRLPDFLGQMGGRVKTSEYPVGIDQTHKERNTVRGPARRVDKVGEDEFSRPVCRSCRRNGNQDDNERDEGDV